MAAADQVLTLAERFDRKLVVTLVGPSGSGKSTLMRIICGILEQSYGQLTINGIDVREKREELQGPCGQAAVSLDTGYLAVDR
mgnify:CR=1 FL=1